MNDSTKHLLKCSVKWHVVLVSISVFCFVVFFADAENADSEQNLWNLRTLGNSPSFHWVDKTKPVRSLLYTGCNYRGKPTEIFALYASPATLAGREVMPQERFPCMVLVHGGDGTAFERWVELWAKRGYAAIAMDLSGRRPDILSANGKPQRLPDGGPEQSNVEKFQAIVTDTLDDDWVYHAVSRVILAHSLVLSFPEVDKDRTGITGISWGGYLTCIVASLDSRFKAAAPVYGCGFLSEGGPWPIELAKLGEQKSLLWAENYDPKQYLRYCKIPMLFVSGNNDRFYPLNIFMKSYFEVEESKRNLLIVPNMIHGHEPGWSVPEIGYFMDVFLRNKIPGLPVCYRPERNGDVVYAKYDSSLPIKDATMFYTSASNSPNDSQWMSIPMRVAGDRVEAALAKSEDFTYFFIIKDDRGMRVSSPVIFSKGISSPDKL